MTEEVERIIRVETKVEVLEQTVREMHNDLRHIRSTLDQAKGGWRVMLIFAGVAASIGSIAGWLISHLKLIGS